MVADPSTTTEERKKIENALALYQAAIEHLEKMEIQAKGKEIIDSLKQNMGIVKEAWNRAIDTAAAGNTQSAITTLTGTLQISGNSQSHAMS